METGNCLDVYRSAQQGEEKEVVVSIVKRGKQSRIHHWCCFTVDMGHCVCVCLSLCVCSLGFDDEWIRKGFGNFQDDFVKNVEGLPFFCVCALGALGLMSFMDLT